MWPRRVRENLKKGGQKKAKQKIVLEETKRAARRRDRAGSEEEEEEKKKKHASQVAPLIPGFTHHCRCLSLESVGLVCHVSILYWFVRRLISRGVHVKQLLSSLM